MCLTLRPLRPEGPGGSDRESAEGTTVGTICVECCGDALSVAGVAACLTILARKYRLGQFRSAVVLSWQIVAQKKK